MKYRTLGNTQEKVSLLALGTMTWGEQNTCEEAAEQMDYAVSQGINFFDTAEMYPVPPKEETYGKTEEFIGQWLSSRQCRSELFLATKVLGRVSPTSTMAYARGGARLNREHLTQALEGSLKRLQTDYIDLYQVHWPERQTNYFGQLGYVHGDDDGVEIAETLEVLTEFVKQGKVKYIGISNETPWGIMEYLRLHWQKGFEKIQSIQNPYSLLNRSFEVGCAEMAIRENVGLLAYSPLAFGVLTGKYMGGAKPEGARLTLFERFQRYNSANADAATEAYVELAKAQGLTPAQLALAFINQQPFLTSNIIGATSMEQLKENISSVDVTLSKEACQEIESIHQRYSNPAP